MGKQKSLSGSGNLGASIGQGASIANMAYNADTAAPSQHDNDAALFSSMAGAFSNSPNRPRGILNNLAAGMANGAAYGARSKGIAEKRGKNEKFQKVMEYFQQANQSAIEQNQWYEKREAAKSEMMPQVLAYMDNIDKLDPQSQRIMAQDMLAQYGEALGENFKLSSIDGSNPFLMTIQSDKGPQLFDLRSMFAGDAEIRQSIATKMPGYQMKLQEERQDKQREFALKEEKLAMEREYMPEKYSVQREKLGQKDRSLDQNDAKINMKLNETLGKKIDASREFLTIAPKMKQIVTDHPDIFQSAKDAIWRDNESPGFFSNMIKDLQNKWSPEKIKALTSMYKYINKMTLDVANGFARPNIFIEKIGSKAVPNLDMSPEGFKDILEEMTQENQTSIKNNSERLKLLERQGALSGQYKESTQGVMGDETIPQSTVVVKNPETGEETEIDEKQLDAAVEAGYEHVG